LKTIRSKNLKLNYTLTNQRVCGGPLAALLIGIGDYPTAAQFAHLFLAGSNFRSFCFFFFNLFENSLFTTHFTVFTFGVVLKLSMPQPVQRVIPPEAGYPGLPIDDSKPDFKKARAYMKEVTLPRREYLAESNQW
jgi:hypothetical protein